MQSSNAAALTLLVWLTWLHAGRLFAEPVDSDPRAIMNAVYEQTTGQRRSTHLKMQISDGTGTRERSLVMRATSSREARRSLILIDSPADARGSGFLSIDYVDQSRADERWVYLPALRRTTRVASSQLSNAFLGSDFSFADLSPPDPTLFEFKLQDPSATVDGEDCWLITAAPKSQETAKSTGYRDSEFWVSKSKLAFVRVRVSLFDNKTKYIKASQFEQAKGAWVPGRVEARTVQDGNLLSETVLEVVSMNADDASVTDADFTKQRLERGL